MKKLKVFETFAGIGAQTKALTNIGIDFEVVGTSEWFIDAIIGYNAIHKKRFKKYKRQESLEFLEKYTLSNDSKKPLISYKKMSDEKLSNIVSSMKANKNLGSILEIKGKDVPEHDLWTYSFPCQDLSIAGKGKGITKESGTRSSLMWEVERIISEIDSSKRPSFLLMENVPAIQNIKYKQGLDHFKSSLEDLGYTQNIGIVLNASKLGIPQRRKRYFMISIHQDAHFVGGGGLKTNF